MAQNLVFHARTKHIEVQYYFIREKIMDGEIVAIYVSTKEQLTDGKTKPLGRIKFEGFRNQLGLENWLEIENKS
jgi:hypothetical protein